MGEKSSGVIGLHRVRLLRLQPACPRYEPPTVLAFRAVCRKTRLRKRSIGEIGRPAALPKRINRGIPLPRDWYTEEMTNSN
jgi:hypothetical protein